MNIAPIQPINTLADLNQAAPAAKTGSELPFQALFEDAASKVEQTSGDLDQKTAQLATGDSDNLHDIMIASQKATLSVQLLVQLRNKVLDSYNEIMRMNV